MYFLLLLLTLSLIDYIEYYLYVNREYNDFLAIFISLKKELFEENTKFPGY